MSAVILRQVFLHPFQTIQVHITSDYNLFVFMNSFLPLIQKTGPTIKLSWHRMRSVIKLFQVSPFSVDIADKYFPPFREANLKPDGTKVIYHQILSDFNYQGGVCVDYYSADI